MRILPLIICTALLALCCYSGAAEDLDALSKSPVWEVRYCVPSKIDAPSAEARRVLERLSVDEVPSVAQQAFAVYTRIFVVLDHDIVQKAFTRGDFHIVGISVRNMKVFHTPEFWTQQLSRADEASSRARPVRALGMCGTTEHTKMLSEYMATTNSYLLIELALAFHRLGDQPRYLEAIEAILALPLKEAFFYQTYAVDCLIQTHPARARTAWKRVHEQFEGSKDSPQAWVYSHILQEARLP